MPGGARSQRQHPHHVLLRTFEPHKVGERLLYAVRAEHVEELRQVGRRDLEGAKHCPAMVATTVQHKASGGDPTSNPTLALALPLTLTLVPNP